MPKVPALVQAATHSCNYSDENKNTKGAQPVHLKGTKLLIRRRKEGRTVHSDHFLAWLISIVT